VRHGSVILNHKLGDRWEEAVVGCFNLPQRLRAGITWLVELLNETEYTPHHGYVLGEWRYSATHS